MIKSKRWPVNDVADPPVDTADLLQAEPAIDQPTRGLETQWDE